MSEVTLREVAAGDLEIFFEHQRDAVANEMAAFPSRDRDAFFVHWGKITADPSNLLRTVVSDGEVAGNIGCWEQDGEREVGYWIGREFWGRGIATNALSQFLSIARWRPLFAHVIAHNLGSMRVLEKCGFALLREDRIDEGGETISEFVFVLR